MVNPVLGIGILILSLLVCLIQLLCATYHFLDEYYPEQLDGFEVVGVTLKEAIFEIFIYVASRLQRLWDIVCAIIFVLMANLCPSLVTAYQTIYFSEHSDTITDIIVDSIVTHCSLLWIHLRGDTL